MSKQKIEWCSVGIPKTLFEKIRKLIVYVGCPSVSEYVREAARKQYDRDFDLAERFENEVERTKDEM